MSDARGEQEEQRAIEAAQLAAEQTEKRVDTWIKENTPRIQQEWQQQHGRNSLIKYFQQDSHEYQPGRRDWEITVRKPAVEHAVAQEAVREGIVPREAAERYLSQSNIVFDHGDIGRREVALQVLAGEVAYEQTLEQSKTPSREVPSPALAGRQERDQAERSPEMAARGWGQSWDEQQHAQERERH